MCRAVLIVLAMLVATSAAGQTADSPGTPTTPPLPPAAPGGGPGAGNGLQASMPPASTLDDKGGRTIRAFRLDRPLDLNGRLDEDIYRSIPPIGDLIQMEPREGEPATNKTEAWVLFDDENVYVSARCWDDQPDRWVVTEMRRDNFNITQNENFAVSFDTFNDGRNGFFFQTTPAGAIRDQTFTDEANANVSWNTVWEAKAGRFEHGWTFEMAIPFKSLRYRGSGPQVWRINFRRIVRWKNETAFLTRVPAAYGGNAPFRMSVAATLVGLETPAQSMNLELKPYVISALTADRAAAVPLSNDLSKNAGFDFKYGLTRGLIADATFRTDFAQVEEDLQQVNLTRFSLFFPEKRDFFLEGQGIFGFSGSVTGDVPVLFFSRRIGLIRGQAVPVIAGGRLTGTVGKFAVGALNIQTDEDASAGAVKTNFTVLRIKRDVLRRSNIGIMATRQTPSGTGSGSNTVVGVDANLSFFQNVMFNSYYATSQTSGTVEGDESSYRARFDYAADRYGLLVEHLLVGDRFNPEVGFVRRQDFSRSIVTARFSPRPKSGTVVRKLNWVATQTYTTNASRTVVENRQTYGNFGIDFDNSDRADLEYFRDFEYVPVSFRLAPNVVVPVGGYDYDTIKASYSIGQQRPLSGLVTVATGTFYDGRRTDATFTSGRAALSTRLSIEPGITLNWVDVPGGRFRNELIAMRVIFTPSPRSLVTSLMQYNQGDRSLSSSVRLRWEYTAGSELFVVYSDARNTPAAIAPGLMNRSVAVKLTRLFRF